MCTLDLNNYFGTSVEILRRDWDRIKNTVQRQINKGNLERSLSLLEEASRLAYTYNFVLNYWDPDIEDFLQQIARRAIQPGTRSNVTFENRIVLFDSFALENRGFSQQLVSAFITAKVEILYVVESLEKYQKENRIIQLVEEYQHGKVAPLHGGTRLSKINEAIALINSFQAGKVFIHTSPWELISCCFANWYQFSTTKCYLINITDHAFWPGISCFEYVIDFRAYGSYINGVLKGKSVEKLLKIRFPAYVDDSVPFAGFPVDIRNKIVGFSGGSFYKILDEHNTFLNLVKDVLVSNPNFIFLFVCIGGEAHVRNFIDTNNLHERFILLGNRRDIGQVFKRIDIFFNTYPYGGGLMLQYAVQNRRPVLSLWNEGLSNTRIDWVFDCELPAEHIITKPAHFVATAGRLINDPHYRKSYLSHYESAIVSNDQFTKSITELLTGSNALTDNKIEFAINQPAITNFHINSERLAGRWYTPRIFRIYAGCPWYRKVPMLMKHYVFRLVRKFNFI